MLLKPAAIVFLALMPVAAIGAQQEDMQNLRQEFAAISYGYAVDQICDVTANEEKISFLADYIDANWWLWRARTGVNKPIAKKMAEKAWRTTEAGKNCAVNEIADVQKSIELLATFPARAETVLGTPSKSLLNPKPNQKHIFATYQAARLAWIIAKKCRADIEQNDNLFARLMQTRKELLTVFRPDQLAGLEKSTAEMLVWGTIGACTKKRNQFVLLANELLAELGQQPDGAPLPQTTTANEQDKT